MTRSSTPVQVLADHYLATCRTEGKTPKTLRGYEQNLSRFVRWLDSCLDDFSLASAREYVAALQQAERYDGHPFTPNQGSRLAPATVAGHVRVLKAFATWLWEEDFTPENLLARLAIPKAPRKVIPVLDAAEIDRLLGGIDTRSPTGARDLAVLVLFLDTGLRLSELITLRLEDVHGEDQWLKVMGKGQKERLVPFGQRAGRLLARYASFHRPASPREELFLTVDGEALSENTIALLFGRLKKNSGIRRLHPHLLRNTFATNYLVAGGDVFTLQSILGHTTLEMTRHYVALASSHVSSQHRRFSPMDTLSVPSLSARRLGGIRTRGRSNSRQAAAVAIEPILRRVSVRRPSRR